MHKLSTLTLAATLLAGAALADEVWVLPSGNQIVYERDAGSVAILSYKAEVGLEPGLIFLPGLGGNTDNRGTFKGYWVEAGDTGAPCPAAIIDAEGNTWKSWGIAEVTFSKPGFPSKFKLKRGTCFDAPKGSVAAKPVIGAGAK